jgi:putative membrane protein
VRTLAGSGRPLVQRPSRWSALDWFACVAFLFWSAAGLAQTLAGITRIDAERWMLPGWLHVFVDLCLLSGDVILILLAFINTHLHAARQWSDMIAQRWALLVVGAAFVVETIGALTSLPFGEYHYTDRFGPVLGVVPLTVPLAWYIVVTNALFLVRALRPHLSRLGEAAAVGLVCTVYDFVLEPFATTVKGYWQWTEGSVPPLNYIAWFVLSVLLVRLFAPTLSTRHRWDPRPALVLACTMLIFLAGEAASFRYR